MFNTLRWTWAVHNLITHPPANPRGPFDGGTDGPHHVVLTLFLVPQTILGDFPADFTAFAASLCICGKTGCWFSCGSLMKGNPDFGFKEARPASRSLWLLPGNTRIGEENRAQVAVLMHFFKPEPFKKYPSFHSDRELWHHCEDPRSPGRVLARNAAAWPARSKLPLALPHIPSLPTATLPAAWGLYCPWAAQLPLIAGTMMDFQKGDMPLGLCFGWL